MPFHRSYYSRSSVYLTSNPFSCRLFSRGIGGTLPTHALMRDPPTLTVHDPQSPLFYGHCAIIMATWGSVTGKIQKKRTNKGPRRLRNWEGGREEEKSRRPTSKKKPTASPSSPTPPPTAPHQSRFSFPPALCPPPAPPPPRHRPSRYSPVRRQFSPPLLTFCTSTWASPRASRMPS